MLGRLALPFLLLTTQAVPALAESTPEAAIQVGGKIMRLVPGGTFRMGSDDGRADERPVHSVRLDAYYMDETPVTYRDYRVYLGDWRAARPSAPVPRLAYWKYDSYNRPDQPVTGITWFEAACYCDWRGGRHGLGPAYAHSGRVDDWGYPVWTARGGDSVRLPTEAEFERAARGGLDRANFPWGDEFDPAWANFDEGHGFRGRAAGRWWRLARVQDQRPNAYGLFGMSGNVWEWTGDFHGPYRRGWFTPRNPTGPRTGATRVTRGGSWGSPDQSGLRVSRRSFAAPDLYNYDIGFRCVMPASARGKLTTNASSPREIGPSCLTRDFTRPRTPDRVYLRRADLDESFRERLGRYIGERFPESIYFHEQVDAQPVITPRELADLIVDVSLEHDLHPLFLTGIMISESGLGTVSFPRWFNNPMAYHWGNWKMRYGAPFYEPRKYRNRRYRTLGEAFAIFSRGIRRKLYIDAARRDLYRFHMVYVGYEAREWMRTLSRVYRDVAGVDFSEHSPLSGAGRYIYLDWEEH